MARMIGTQPFNAVTFDGRRFDCGAHLGYVEANIAVALERPALAGPLRERMRAMLEG
jgi:UTP--glucose-1-phosphate uridylyltransferase